MRTINNINTMKRIIKPQNQKGLDIIFPMDSIKVRDISHVYCPHCGNVLDKDLIGKPKSSILRCPYCNKNYRF